MQIPVGFEVTIDEGQPTELRGTVVGYGFICSAVQILVRLAHPVVKPPIYVSVLSVHPDNLTTVKPWGPCSTHDRHGKCGNYGTQIVEEFSSHEIFCDECAADLRDDLRMD